MKAAILTIGDEILIGQVTDTNSGFIAKKLDAIGVDVVQMLSIGDDEAIILNTFAYLQNKVELVVITGGLGPTKDDITKKTFVRYFDDVLIEDTAVLTHVTALIEKAYQRPISEINKQQALVPSKSIVLFNDYGTAPGMWMQKAKTVFVSLPGVPYEMKFLTESRLIPLLIQKYNRPHNIHKTIMTYGVGESLLAEQIEEWENKLPDFIKLAYLPSPGRVRLRLSARGTDEKILLQALEDKIVHLHTILGDIIVGYEENEPIEFVVGEKLKAKKQTIATAESCTGGLIASKLVSVSGASAYFKGSIVAYDTLIKKEILSVDECLIVDYGVVSIPVAEQMAIAVKNKMRVDYAISVTGNAGPSLGDETQKAGIVCIAVAHPEGVFSEQFDFGQPREKVINRAANKGLEILLNILLKK